MITLHTETFTPAAELSKYAKDYGLNEGTVEVTFQGQTRRVECIAPNDKRTDWVIYGLCARYATGSKVWHATIWHDGEKVKSVFTGFENRSGRFSRPSLVGFIEKVSEKHISKR